MKVSVSYPTIVADETARHGERLEIVDRILCGSHTHPIASRDMILSAIARLGVADDDYTVGIYACDNPRCPSATCDDATCYQTTRRAGIECAKQRRDVLASRRDHSGVRPFAAIDDLRDATPLDPMIGQQSALKVRRSNSGGTSTQVIRRGVAPVIGETSAPPITEALREIGLVIDAMARESEYRNAQSARERAEHTGRKNVTHVLGHVEMDNAADVIVGLCRAIAYATDHGDKRAAARLNKALDRLTAAVERLTLARAGRVKRAERMRLASVGMAIAAQSARDRVTYDDGLGIALSKHATDISRVSVIAVELGVLAPAQGGDTLQGSSARIWSDPDRSATTVRLPSSAPAREWLTSIDMQLCEASDDAPASHHAFGIVALVAPSHTTRKVWQGHRLVTVPSFGKRATRERQTQVTGQTDREKIGNMQPGDRVTINGVAVNRSARGIWSATLNDRRVQYRTSASMIDALALA